MSQEGSGDQFTSVSTISSSPTPSYVARYAHKGTPPSEPDPLGLDESLEAGRIQEMERSHPLARSRSTSIDSVRSFHSSHRLPQDLGTYLVRRASHRTESLCLPDQSEEPQPIRAMTKIQIFTLISICFTTTCSSSFYSLLAPFFPTEAMSKGATAIQVGFIFGIFQGIVCIMSPIYGKFIVQIGPKFMYVTGIFVTSSCAILFGSLEWCPSGDVYVIMCFVVRGVEAVAAAATSTASLAIAAHTFPESLSKVMGLIEVCSSLGLMLGPPLGGLLYSAGGFHVPFFVTGGLFMLGGLLSFMIMPRQEAEKKASSGNNWDLLKLPIIFIVGYMVFIGQASIGFFDVGLAPQLQKFHVSNAIIGLVFLVPSVSVIILAPINGTLVDKNRKWGRPIIIIGAAVGAFGVLGLGPSPLLFFLPTDEIWVPIVALAVSGMGLSCLVVTYQEFVGAALDAGHVMTMEMQGVIAGTYSAFNSLGALVGPTVGGVMLDRLGFYWSATAYGFAVALASVMLFIYTLITMLGSSPSGCLKKQEDDERTFIINRSL